MAGGMRAVSKKRAAQLRVYARLRVEFLEANPRCAFPGGCDQRATEIQHRRGRRGERLLDVTWWAAACHGCNQFGETNTGESIALGWIVPIEGAA
jgi:hypothetical protein